MIQPQPTAVPPAADSPRLVLWQSPRVRSIFARIAIAGDFLPAGKLALPADSAPWRKMGTQLAGHFQDADVSFVNLECALDAHGLSSRPIAGLGDIVSAPAAALDHLAAISTRVVGFANNHSYDFGPKGVERTRQALLARGLVPLGAGKSLTANPETFVWQSPGNNTVRVGFWAAALASADLATRSASGVEPAALRRAKQAIAALRAGGAQFSIALLHAGCLRTNRPDPAEAARIDSIAAQGFDVVAASHSHRSSGARVIIGQDLDRELGEELGHGDRPRFCFYGLGSIVSGFTASPLEREGLVIVAALDSSGALVNVEVRPVLLAESGFGKVPAPGESRIILDRFRALSREIADGSAARLFYEDVSQGIVHLYARDIRAAFRRAGLRGLARKARRLRLRHVRRLIHGVTHPVAG